MHSEQTWNNQYRSGKWEVLKSPDEQQRFDAIIDVVRKYSTQPSSILDIGCGEGLLRDRLSPEDFSSYYGVDISSVAIGRAQQQRHVRSVYKVSRMEDFQAEHLFDFIVFNESLYYAENPVFQFVRFAKFLSQAGLMILSIYETSGNLKLLSVINQLFSPVEHIVSENKRGRWHCEVFDFAVNE